MATLPLTWNHPTNNSLLLFVCCGQKNLAQMPFSLRSIQYMVISMLQDQQCMFGVKSLLMVEKVLLMKKNLVAVLFRRPMQRSQRSIPSFRLTGVWWDKCLHDFGRYVEKWSVNVWCLNSFACWTCSLAMQFNTLQELLGKILVTDWVLSTSDVTIMTSLSKIPVCNRN